MELTAFTVLLFSFAAQDNPQGRMYEAAGVEAPPARYCATGSCRAARSNLASHLITSGIAPKQQQGSMLRKSIVMTPR